MTFPPNSKTTVTLPFSILEANYDSYDYICIETTDSTIASSKSCILKGEKLNSIYLYPNPTKNLVNISYYIPKPQEIDLELFNIQGESLLSQNIPLNLSGKQSISINLEEYKSGIYILMIKTEDETLIHKIEKNQ